MLFNRSELLTARIYDINPVVDPMGVGDAYLSAFLHSLSNRPGDDQSHLDFSLAAAALKSTVNGDFNLSTEDEIESLLKSSLM